MITLLSFNQMRPASRINRQEQVKVVIRLKPMEADSRYSKCVYLTDQDQNELVVETPNKKDIFVFDSVAHQFSSQIDIYKMIGQEVVQFSKDGFNCCIFAYGQTGAGKTYSVLGDLGDLINDINCESRGILPRLLGDIFSWSKQQREQERHSITCSYMEIYNEQIFDLLASDKKIHQIREDFKKGVFVEGIIEQSINTYEESIALLLQGEKNRTTASTQMNSESSRSHAIFTIIFQSQIVEEDVVKIRKSKVNIVDLAGSERVKHTNVEGERLREGCNINRSLHVLGNVINSLVESSKKKKHIPFRDSKLTHYLKDSLGGNSITRLLANIHCSKQYYGDTLSTLMFAKRAKILKMKVEINQSTSENFDNLRKQVRRLREELAQARYFKNQNRMTERSNTDADLELTFEKITDTSDFEVNAKSQQVLQVFEENESHFKALIEIYQEHMKNCLTSETIQRKHNINIVHEWKNLEKRNLSLTHLLRKMPSFTKIYRQNMLLKKLRIKFEDHPPDLSKSQYNHFTSDPISQEGSHQEQVADFYEALIEEMQLKFKESIQVFEKCFFQTENELKNKDKKIKELRKKKENTPQLDQLINQNQYLKLNILELEDEIANLEDNEAKIRIQIKQSRKNTIKKHYSAESKQSIDASEQEMPNMLELLKQIKASAQKESDIVEAEKNEYESMINELKHQVNSLVAQNNKLQRKYSRSKSRNKRYENEELNMKKSFIENASSIHEEEMHSMQKSTITCDQQFKSLQQHYSKDIIALKMAVKLKQREILDIRNELNIYIKGDRIIEEEFGKSVNEIVEYYRKESKKSALTQSKSFKNIHLYKEEEHFKQVEKKFIEKKISIDNNNVMQKSKGLLDRKQGLRDQKKCTSPK